MFKHSMEVQHFANPKSGFVALVTVLVAGAVGLAVAVSLILSGLGSSRSSLVLSQSTVARMYADSCAEEALEKLREGVYYTGGETLTFSEGNCQIQTVSGTGNSNRTVQTTGTVGTIIRKVEVVVSTVHPTISVTSWQEVESF